MNLEEPVSVDAGRHSPSAPPAVRDVNISVGSGLGTSSAFASGPSRGAGSASASGHSGSTVQLERSFLRLSPGTVVFKCLCPLVTKYV